MRKYYAALREDEKNQIHVRYIIKYLGDSRFGDFGPLMVEILVFIHEVFFIFEYITNKVFN